MPKKIDLVGQRFGRLVALEDCGKRGKGGHVYFLCRCDCGNLKEVSANSLRMKKIKSCGCLMREKSRERMQILGLSGVKHGCSRRGEKERLYQTWSSMLHRCQDPNHNSYKYYNPKGISVCDEWAGDYLAFRRWAMNSGYAEDKVIHRNDKTGNYEPGNCAWLTKSEHSRLHCDHLRGKRWQ